MTQPQLINGILPLFFRLISDDQDTVRMLTVEDLIQIAKMLTPEESKQHLTSVLKSLAQDKSWRVRYEVAKRFTEVGDLT